MGGKVAGCEGRRPTRRVPVQSHRRAWTASVYKEEVVGPWWMDQAGRMAGVMKREKDRPESRSEVRGIRMKKQERSKEEARREMMAKVDSSQWSWSTGEWWGQVQSIPVMRR